MEKPKHDFKKKKHIQKERTRKGGETKRRKTRKNNKFVKTTTNTYLRSTMGGWILKSDLSTL